MLKKLFIKNYEQTSNIEVRNQYGVVAGVFGIITNIILGIIKVILAILSNSVSIMVDAVNNISDMLSSVFTIVGFKLSNKKPDKEHPYGHARYEYIFGLLIAFFMLAMGLLFIKESVIKIIHPKELVINSTTYIILTISILLKILQMIVYLDFSKEINSSTLKTSAIDTRNDILSTFIILLSMIIMYRFNINIDGYLGFIVAIFIIFSAVNQINEVVQPLVGVVPHKKRVNNIKKKILSYDNVIGVHSLVIHNYGVNNDFLTVHVEIDSKLSLIDAHDLVDDIENDLKDSYGYDATIHIDPVMVGNKKIDKTKNRILSELNKLDKGIEIHDFRVVEGKTKDKIIFDCVIPYGKEYSPNFLSKYLKNNIETDKYCVYIIEVERPYC